MRPATRLTCLGVFLLMAGCQRQQAAQQSSALPPAAERPPASPAAYTAADLLTAFKAAYGQPAPVEIPDENGDKMVYNPAALIDITPEIAALIVKGEMPDGCHACTGSDSIFYLRHTGQTFDLLGKWPNLAGQAGFGHAAEWTRRSDLTQYPALIFTSSGSAQGCNITGNDIVELTPSKPILRAQNVITALDYTPGEDDKSPAKNLVGKIATTGPDHKLQAVYTGSEVYTLNFWLDGETWKPAPLGRDAPTC